MTQILTSAPASRLSNEEGEYLDQESGEVYRRHDVYLVRPLEGALTPQAAQYVEARLNGGVPAWATTFAGLVPAATTTVLCKLHDARS